jgi:hypothetical protein
MRAKEPAMGPIRQEVADTLAELVADFATEITHDLRPKAAAMEAALRAAKADPMACHSIAVWDQIDAALGD